MYPLSRWCQWIILAASAVVGLSALGGIGVSLFSDRTVWFLLAFECVVLLSAAFGVLIGRGRFAQAPALAILFTAGAIGGASLLGYLAARTSVTQVDVRLWLAVRVGLIGAMTLVAVLNVLGRRPSISLPLVARAAIFLALFAGTVAGAWFFRAQILALSGPVKAIIAMVGSVWLLGTFAPGVHFLIRAFEAGRLPDRIDAAKPSA